MEAKPQVVGALARTASTRADSRHDGRVASDPLKSRQHGAITVSRIGFAVLVCISVVSGYCGFSHYLHGNTMFHHNVIDKLYYDAQLFVFAAAPVANGGPFPWMLEVARFTAPAATVYALAGLFWVLVADEVRRLRIRALNGHVIVCGETDTAKALAAALSGTCKKVIVASGSTPARASGASVASAPLKPGGDLRILQTLIDAGLRGAEALYACTADVSVNVAIASTAARAVAAKAMRAPLNAYVLVEDPRLCLALRARRNGREESDKLRLEFFNPDELAARSVVRAMDLAASRSDRPIPQIVVHGLGTFSDALIVNLARRWRPYSGAGKLKIVVVAAQAGRGTTDLLGRYPSLADSCALRPYERSLADYLTDRETARLAAPDAVFICDPDENRALNIALTTTGLWRCRPESVVVRVNRIDGLHRAFNGHTALFDSLGARMNIVGVGEVAYEPMTIGEDFTELLARAVHDRYVAERVHDGETPAENPSMLAWEDLPEDLRESNRAQAQDIGRKLAMIGGALVPSTSHPGPRFSFTAEEVERLSEHEHERWMAQHTAHGWTYGAQRDDAKKKHPDMVPWNELTAAAKDKDREAVSALPSLLGDAGLTIVRTG